MPNSLQSSAIASPASRRATNCSLSSITEHSFQGIIPSPSTGRKCYLRVRYNVLPMSQVGHILAWKNTRAIDSIARMFNLLFGLLSLAGAMPANDLPTKEYLDLAAIETMVAAAEAEAKKRNVDVTICVVEDSG